MKKFKRSHGVISSHLEPYEVELLESLVGQLVELVDDGSAREDPADTAPSDDPFELWARDLQVDPDEPEVPEDPVLQRLFPNAYPHDSAASSDFRRFTERDLRQRKVDAASVVLADLAATESGTRPLEIDPERATAWLKTLTSLRLSLAARLGIDDDDSSDELHELSEEDPRSFLVSVYDWLGFAQETLIHAL